MRSRPGRSVEADPRPHQPMKGIDEMNHSKTEAPVLDIGVFDELENAVHDLRGIGVIVTSLAHDIENGVQKHNEDAMYFLAENIMKIADQFASAEDTLFEIWKSRKEKVA
jgi:hypothetical protein